MTVSPPIVTVHLAEGRLQPGPAPRRETLAHTLLRQRARADGRGELTDAEVDAELATVQRPALEVRAWGKIETPESSLTVEKQVPEIKRRRYDVPEEDRQRRREHAKRINRKRRGVAAEQRDEVVRLAKVALGGREPVSEEEWSLPRHREELLSTVWEAWGAESTELRKPTHQTMLRWLDVAIHEGELQTRTRTYARRRAIM